MFYFFFSFFFAFVHLFRLFWILAIVSLWGNKLCISFGKRLCNKDKRHSSHVATVPCRVNMRVREWERKLCLSKTVSQWEFCQTNTLSDFNSIIVWTSLVILSKIDIIVLYGSHFVFDCLFHYRWFPKIVRVTYCCLK